MKHNKKAFSFDLIMILAILIVGAIVFFNLTWFLGANIFTIAGILLLIFGGITTMKGIINPVTTWMIFGGLGIIVLSMFTKILPNITLSAILP